MLDFFIAKNNGIFKNTYTVFITHYQAINFKTVSTKQAGGGIRYSLFKIFRIKMHNIRKVAGY